MDQEVQKSNDESSSNNNTNGVLKDETLTKTPLINLEKPNTNPTINNSNNGNSQELIDIHRTEQSSNISSWVLYLIVIGISIYFIIQNTDPLNISFTFLGCGVTLFLLHKTLNRKIYKLEDDDDGVNLIEG